MYHRNKYVWCCHHLSLCDVRCVYKLPVLNNLPFLLSGTFLVIFVRILVRKSDINLILTSSMIRNSLPRTTKITISFRALHVLILPFLKNKNYPWHGLKYKKLRPAWSPHSLIYWVLRLKRPRHEACLPLIPTLRMLGPTTPLPHTPSLGCA